jgi:Spy/CpxP family protein refolding chaperone
VNRWRVILAAAVIFLAGAGTGAIVTRTFAPKIVKRTHVSQPLPTGPDRRQEYIARLDRELQLTAEQRTQVEVILAASQKRMKELWEPMEPQVKEEYRRTRREISEILSPEQQARMKQWRKDRDDRHKDGMKDGEKASGSEQPEKLRRCSRGSCCL